MNRLTLAGLLGSTALAQQVFLPAQGPTDRPQCEASQAPEPTYSFTPFSYTLTTTQRTATSVTPSAATTYACPPEVLATLIPSQSYTTWGKWDPNATETASDTDNPYGNAAWTALWEYANPPNFTETGVYSTTVEPTPIPSEELVLPPRDYFGPNDCYNFPEGFEFGVSSSASQVEGATAEEGKSPSLMDILVQDDRAKSYVTNENYYLYKQDIERVAAMGVKYFSFSIAWTRILPFALPETPVNQEGIDHYNDLIDFIVSKGMVPEVTLLHFDTPLQFYGDNLTEAQRAPEIGYVNGAYQNETFPDAFVNYAKIVMTHYADRVATWFTFNEPLLYCDNGQSVYNVIKAHSQVYHFYKEELNGQGKISMKFNNNFGVPRDPTSQADVEAADHFNSFQLGPFCNPIYLGIDYPESYKSTIQDYVPLTAEDLEYMNGTADFLGIDPYTATVIAPPEAGNAQSIMDCAANASSTYRPYCVNQTTTEVNGWNIGYRSQTYVYITPTYLRSYLNYLWNTWRHPVVLTEFGFPVFGEDDKEVTDQLFDTPRSLYYLSFMSEVLNAIWEDGVHVSGAFAWSYMDNWEFGDYTAHFGIQTVNRTSQERRYKKSFFDLVDFMKARGVE
ncbi:glycoside hydrolase superfamily [Emericellopsis atlantica]|uniref:Glycoside hydrolase superfamily n=1 Tax=Emericellopsis atlantica TaxID=2614577 RepID=A0A9P7ZJD8_9HYPO|nr:glycoside hydrolase superfamily [Emericellopsis atlantica]KAG9253105.1 glycoside hydrolase superfamily [Emericellopsis atlantica]